jgi:hypothetical protein
MERLVECPACRRHIQPTERSCPFCGRGRSARLLGALALAAGITVATPGCPESGPKPPAPVYGGPPPRLQAPPAPVDSTTPPDSPPAPAYGAPPAQKPK